MQMARVGAGRGLRKLLVIDDEDLTLGQYYMVRQEIEGSPTLFLPGLPLLLAAIGFEIAMWIIPAGFGAGNKWRRTQLQLADRRFDARRIRETGWAAIGAIELRGRRAKCFIPPTESPST